MTFVKADLLSLCWMAELFWGGFSCFYNHTPIGGNIIIFTKVDVEINNLMLISHEILVTTLLKLFHNLQVLLTDTEEAWGQEIFRFSLFAQMIKSGKRKEIYAERRNLWSLYKHLYIK